MAQSAPTVYSINACHSFADTLVQYIRDAAANGPYALSDYLILVPNRRAQLTVRQAFLRASGGKSQILPAIRPIGDVDDEELIFLGAGIPGFDPSHILPALSDKRRLFLLSQQIMQWLSAGGTRPAPAAAWRLARDLANFMDQVDNEGLDLSGLDALVPEELAHHWAVTLDFLQIVVKNWPTILEAEGAQNPAARRRQLIEHLVDLWSARPPTGPVIAAGSTGTLPATAALLKLVSRLPHGAVFLPGLDLEMDEDSWENIGVTHPQFAMKRLLGSVSVDRMEVEEVTVSSNAVGEDRQTLQHLINDALRPAQNTNIWRHLGYADLTDGELFARMRKQSAPNRREEAEVIAAAMRAALETPNKTAALVTPDRRLARYVRLAFKRWDIEVDDTGGDRALISPTGRFLTMISDLLAADFAPVALLSLCQHPLMSNGMSRSAFLAFTRDLEMRALRGSRPKAGRLGVLARVQSSLRGTGGGGADDFLKTVEQLLAAFDSLVVAFEEGASLHRILTAHIALAERLASTVQTGTTGDIEYMGEERLWRGEAGQALAEALADLIDQSRDLGRIEAQKITPGEYAALFEEMLADIVVRPKWNRHPRLSILGPIEARLVRADLMILGGLSEGVWPGEAGADPWMSKGMRAEFGLPDRSRRIGQSAHDFVQAALANEVLLTYSEKIGGAPSVQSRWLFKIEALAGRAIPHARELLHWSRSVNGRERQTYLSPPAPRPPLDARPDRLSVTQVETWMRDPYALYAKKILDLRPLKKVDERPDAAIKGTLIHKAFEIYSKENFNTQSPSGLPRLLEIGQEVFDEVANQPTVYAFWWPRFVDAATAFIDHEATWGLTHQTCLVEDQGSLSFTAPSFVLTAKADRIDQRKDSGALTIIDYKTGNIPTERRMMAGFAPQLPLEALIAEKGGFKTIGRQHVDALQFWLVKGGVKPLDIKEPVKDMGAVVSLAEEGLLRLITLFNDPETPYFSNPRPSEVGYGDYDHLARVKEWRFLGAQSE